MDDLLQAALTSPAVASYELAFQGQLDTVGSTLQSGHGHLFNAGNHPAPPGNARTIPSTLQVQPLFICIFTFDYK